MKSMNLRRRFRTKINYQSRKKIQKNNENIDDLNADVGEYLQEMLKKTIDNHIKEQLHQSIDEFNKEINAIKSDSIRQILSLFGGEKTVNRLLSFAFGLNNTGLGSIIQKGAHDAASGALDDTISTFLSSLSQSSDENDNQVAYAQQFGSSTGQMEGMMTSILSRGMRNS